MAKLTKPQLAFIEKMELNLYELFDASGLKTPEWKIQMKELGKLVAFGVTPCAVKGHTMRTRAGHCVQCNPANLSYLKRMNLSADVYVAWSSSAKLAKVGLAIDANQRRISLNKYKYAGVNDWEMKLIYECENAGEIENQVHRLLSEFSKFGVSYWNSDRYRLCTEIFKCRLKEATDALEKVVQLAA